MQERKRRLLILMKNVYEKIQDFYRELSDYYPIITRSLVDGYLRQRAWQGLGYDELEEVWIVLQAFLRYVTYEEFVDLDKIVEDDYQNLLLWIIDDVKKDNDEEQALKDIFIVLKDFYAYLIKKNVLLSLDGLHNAEQKFSSVESLSLPNEMTMGITIFDENFQESDLLIEDIADKLNLLLERLLSDIGRYFKGEKFIADFNRALSLYSGPFNAIPEDDGEEFWLGFWDYFLFDYHLIETDSKPLAHFYKMKQAELTHDEKHVISDLLQAKFTVFYIKRILNNSMVECVDLFTDEIIKLPMPDYGIGDYKKMLFYGHIYVNGIVMLNYISSISVSKILRKRIKEEILHQCELYKAQDPLAGIADFFKRHAILVRHTIDILVNLAKLNVVQPERLNVHFEQNTIIDDPDFNVTVLLQIMTKKYQLSIYDMKLLLKMWCDYSSLRKKVQDKAELIASAIFLIFIEMNGIHHINSDFFKRELNLLDSELNQQMHDIIETLELQEFDSRYLTEEGFVLSLYVF